MSETTKSKVKRYEGPRFVNDDYQAFLGFKREETKPKNYKPKAIKRIFKNAIRKTGNR